MVASKERGQGDEVPCIQSERSERDFARQSIECKTLQSKGFMR